MSPEVQGPETNALLLGLLALAAAEREERLGQGGQALRKTELLLADVGVDVATIGAVTGKKGDAIRKAIQRDRRSQG